MPVKIRGPMFARRYERTHVYSAYWSTGVELVRWYPNRYMGGLFNCPFRIIVIN